MPQEFKMQETGLNNIQDFSKSLEEDIVKYIAEGKTVESFLKAKYHITNIKDLDFDINEKDHNEFGFMKVRGNVNLMMGNIRTYKESQKIIDEVLNYDFESLINYKP
jgi:hypothetical protein